MRLTRVVAALAVLAAGAQAPETFERAFARFLQAGTPEAAEAAAAAVVETGVEFETVYARLAAGSDLPRAPAAGRSVVEHHTGDGTPHPYVLIVPERYDPVRAYPVRVYLHGGVNRPAGPADGSWWRRPERVAGDDHIAVFPYSWSDSLWWQERQAESLAAILWRLKRTYNVDDNRVFLFGVSARRRLRSGRSTAPR